MPKSIWKFTNYKFHGAQFRSSNFNGDLTAFFTKILVLFFEFFFANKKDHFKVVSCEKKDRNKLKIFHITNIVIGNSNAQYNKYLK